MTLTGYVTRLELARELRSAHVLAFPSLFEGFGIPVLEAMAAGLPVVVSDRTSLPEVAGGAGLVAPAEDAGAWADALGHALEPVEHARLAGARPPARARFHLGRRSHHCRPPVRRAPLAVLPAAARWATK